MAADGCAVLIVALEAWCCRWLPGMGTTGDVCAVLVATAKARLRLVSGPCRCILLGVKLRAVGGLSCWC